MTLTLKPNDFFIFDLDDTLYKEIDFLKSAYQAIAQELEGHIGKNIYPEMCGMYEAGESTFDLIKDKYDFPQSIMELVAIYRFHQPNIQASEGVLTVLQELQQQGIKLGIITDGRSLSQRNKIKALGITSFFEEIVISEEIGSEKPSPVNFQFYENKYPNFRFTYIGDNIKKDFISPNQLGWQTIGIKDNGQNIHPQSMAVPKSHLPEIMLNSFTDFNLIFV